MLDTRNGTGTVQGKVGPGGLVTLTLPSGSYANASAVLLNVTETNATASSWVGVEPSAGGVPSSSVLDFTAGQTSANLVVAPVSNGQVQFYNRYGSVDLIGDVEGYVAPNPETPQEPADSPYFPLSPPGCWTPATARAWFKARSAPSPSSASRWRGPAACRPGLRRCW